MRVLQTHVERVQKKQRTAYDNALQQVDHIISLIEDVKAALLSTSLFTSLHRLQPLNELPLFPR